MTEWVAAVIGASLIGSVHCAGMCGPLAAMLLGGSSVRSRAALVASWHAGRLLVYAALGVVAGAAGALLDLGFSVTSAQGAALRLAGVGMIVIGAVAILRRLGVRLPTKAASGPPWIARVTRGVASLPPSARGVALGAGTALLPCGWLYAFVLAAAGTADPMKGGGLMIAFWLGTVPLLLLSGVGGSSLLRAAAGRAPWLPEAALVAVGVLMLVHRNPLPPDLGERSPALVNAKLEVPSPADRLPCCDDHDR